MTSTNIFEEEDGKDSNDNEENVNMNDSKRVLDNEPDDQTISRGVVAYNIQPISRQGNPRNRVTQAAKVIPNLQSKTQSFECFTSTKILKTILIFSSRKVKEVRRPLSQS